MISSQNIAIKNPVAHAPGFWFIHPYLTQDLASIQLLKTDLFQHYIMGIQNLLERPPTLFLVQYHLQDNLPLHHIPIRKRHIHRLYLRRFIYSELSANYISYITVYSYTYKHLHHPITSALYTPYHRRIMPIRMHSRLVIDFHNYLISLFLLTMILISP